MIYYGLTEDNGEKKKILRSVMESLLDWFEMEEGRETYIRESEEQLCFSAYDDDRPVGFLCLKETGKDTVEIAVMGVCREYHGNGIGKRLFLMAEKTAAEREYSFIQVKTVRMGMYEDYDRTNRFYLAMGFKEFEIIESLWGKDNPCQIYVKSLDTEGK